jgi:transcriptional regulator with XRE-family HTH domain
VGKPGTFAERVRTARGARSQEEIAAGVASRGVPFHQNTLSRIELNDAKRIEPEQLFALALELGEDPYYLLVGERRDAEDTDFIRAMRAFERDGLDERGQYVVVQVARVETEEAKKRASDGLSDEEREWVRLLRAASPEERRDALAVAGARPAPAPRRKTERQAERPTRRRAQPKSA